MTTLVIMANQSPSRPSPRTISVSSTTLKPLKIQPMYVPPVALLFAFSNAYGSLLKISSSPPLSNNTLPFELEETAFHPNNTPWIYYGGSYAGARAAHMRVQYPNLVWGAIASSG